MNGQTAGVVLLLALSVAAPVGTAGVAVAGSGGQQNSACAGTIDRPAEGVTVVSIQGAMGGNKTTARQIAYGPEGEVVWTNDAGDRGVVWSYDVDPMANGHLFVTATKPGRTLLYELDPETNERVWSEDLNLLDTHDADPIGDDRILIANMRNYDESARENEDRILIYDRSSDEVVWEWRFADHYPESVGGNYEDDWTHVNDVDRIAPGRYLVSPRNFDQAIVVDRSTGDVDLQLGADGETDVLNQQHNPDYLETAGGEPTMLVGDSENNRVVEYTKTNGSWTRTWAVGNRSTLRWPRDADRLPSGNTLITDSRNHRVLEVTPTGEVVWEVYTPWLPYDAERVRWGDGSRGPTVADQNATGDPPLRGSAGEHDDESTLEACASLIDGFEGGTLEFTVQPPRTTGAAGPTTSAVTDTGPTRTALTPTGSGSSSATGAVATDTTVATGSELDALRGVVVLALGIGIGVAVGLTILRFGTSSSSDRNR